MQVDWTLMVVSEDPQVAIPRQAAWAGDQVAVAAEDPREVTPRQVGRTED